MTSTPISGAHQSKDLKNNPLEWLQCIRCGQVYSQQEIRYFCQCGALLSVERRPDQYQKLSREVLAQRALSHHAWDISGVWRFREVVLSLDYESIVTHPEGGTHLYFRQKLADYAGVEDLHFKHEGENPTGSFKDRGMTVAVSLAKSHRLKAVACASTGNTSASLAAYAAHAGLKAVVFVPAGKITAGKLAQAVGYGATVLAIQGDFDAAMDLVQKTALQLGLYLVNSMNPFRLEGQKTIIFELLHQLQWQAPDWIVVPAGNLGNTSAFGKALREARAAGWIQKTPRILAVQAEHASPFATSFAAGLVDLTPVKAETIATAIRIGNPVNWTKARDVILDTKGYVTKVSDQEIMEAKSAIDASGLGAEPASAATLAGVKQLVAQGIVKKTEKIVCILTGHILKDPDAILNHNSLSQIPTIEPTLKAVESFLSKRV